MYPQWRNWLAHGTYKTVVVSDAGVVSSSLTWGTFFFATFFIVGVGGWVGVHLGSPLQPQFEDVVVAAALDHLVAGVVSDVIQFILHKQISADIWLQLISRPCNRTSICAIRGIGGAYVFFEVDRGALQQGPHGLVGVPGHRVGPKSRHSSSHDLLGPQENKKVLNVQCFLFGVLLGRSVWRKDQPPPGSLRPDSIKSIEPLT
jgi:hypothetical protein